MLLNFDFKTQPIQNLKIWKYQIEIQLNWIGKKY